ncbi:MAG: regulatory protein RecX [Candidatus Omnitrophica bacterium]|nr:regulatory protein RecX [Candidatus Omnitrophota bacterium]
MPETVSSLERARAQALLLLKFRPRSESELRRRLTSKRVDPAVLDSLLVELKKKDLVNDEKFARYFAGERMASKPMSRRALVMDLKAKGVSSDVALQAVGQSVGEQDEFQTARELALRRVAHLKGVGKEALQRRLAGFLARRGFSSEVVYKVVREVGGRSSVRSSTGSERTGESGHGEPVEP